MRDLGSLGNCLMEGEESAGLRSPRRGHIALLLSISLQVMALTALMLIPLLVSSERLQATWLETPPPITGPGRVPPQDPRPAGGQPTRQKPVADWRGPIVQPPSIPAKIEILNDADAGVGVPDLGSGGLEIPGAISILEPNAPRWPPPVPEPPKPTPAPKQKVAVSEGVQQARLIHRVQPVYPPLAKQTGLQGTVVLRALIGTDGAVREVQLVSGPYLLGQAAMDAVLQWRYQPTLLNGQPMEVETRITVIFTLNR